MTTKPDRIYVELVPQSDAVHFIAASTCESVYEDIAPYSAVSGDSVQKELSAFCQGLVHGDQLHWAIRDSATKELLGSLQTNLRSQRTIDVGYVVLSRHRGKGVATAALGRLVAQLHAAMPSYQLLGSAHHTNLASQKVLKKAGFVCASEAGAATGAMRHFQYAPAQGGRSAEPLLQAAA